MEVEQRDRKFKKPSLEIQDIDFFIEILALIFMDNKYILNYNIKQSFNNILIMC